MPWGLLPRKTLLQSHLGLSQPSSRQRRLHSLKKVCQMQSTAIPTRILQVVRILCPESFRDMLFPGSGPIFKSKDSSVTVFRSLHLHPHITAAIGEFSPSALPFYVMHTSIRSLDPPARWITMNRMRSLGTLTRQNSGGLFLNFDGEILIRERLTRSRHPGQFDRGFLLRRLSNVELEYLELENLIMKTNMKISSLLRVRFIDQKHRKQVPYLFTSCTQAFAAWTDLWFQNQKYEIRYGQRFLVERSGTKCQGGRHPFIEDSITYKKKLYKFWTWPILTTDFQQSNSHMFLTDWGNNPDHNNFIVLSEDDPSWPVR